MKRILITLLLLTSVMAQASFRADELLYNESVQEGINPDGYPNLSDDKGRQGMWTIWGHMIPEKQYPEDGKIEEGNYIDNRRNGMWTKFHKDGKTPRLKGEYIDNRPNGAYTKFHANGVVKEEGKFTSGKNVEVFRMYYDTGVMSQEKNFNEDGVEDGTVRYFYPSGQVEFEYTKKGGVTNGDATRFYENGDIKEVVSYKNGEETSRESKERVNPAFNSEPEVEIPSADAPNGSDGTTNGKRFKKNGYNKVYNSNEELWMDGEFKSNLLWDGRLYIYDNDGILLKIEVWKKGKYHSDGQLD